MVQIINCEKAPQAIGPYSQAVVAGELVFISGQLPIHPEKMLMPEAVAEQTGQCLENLKMILEEVGLELRDVVKATIYLQDMKDFAIVNEVYGSFFVDNYPARVCVEVSKLPKDALVEIDAIAHKC
jgi:2-iminobutanoate/2-iminopropanoate deaminase